MEKKQFALEQIAPYFKDKNLCGVEDNSCANLTSDGKMCVAGKNLLKSVRDKHPNNSIGFLFTIYKTQDKIFIPEIVDILSQWEWTSLQYIHDNIAQGYDLSAAFNVVNLFTRHELEEFCKK